MRDKKKTRLIYRNRTTGEKVEFRKPDSISYVYDGKNWEFVPDESFFRNIRPNVTRY